MSEHNYLLLINDVLYSQDHLFTLKNKKIVKAVELKKNDIYLFKKNNEWDTVTGSFVMPFLSKYPSKLLDSWIQITELDTEKDEEVKYVIALYMDNSYPKGTIIFSKFIRNRYPTAYITMHKNGKCNRIYSDPKHRRIGLISNLSPLTRTLMYKKFGCILTHADYSSPLADKAHSSSFYTAGVNKKFDRIKKKLFIISPKTLWNAEKKPPRNVMQLDIWHEERISEK